MTKRPRAGRSSNAQSPHLWQVVVLPNKGLALQTTRDVKPGECVLAEAPLISFSPIQKDIIYQKEWLKVGKRSNGDALANGRETIANDISKLLPAVRRTFRKLHGSSPRTDGRDYTERDDGFRDHDPNRVALNAFEEHERHDGVLCSVQRVFENISRINHSCKPNAVMSWNSNLGEGTVYATTAIGTGEEITISYYPDRETLFCSVRDRCRMLHASFKFVCTCPACGPEDTLEHKTREVGGRHGRSRASRSRAETPLDGDMKLRMELRALSSIVVLKDVPDSLDPTLDISEMERNRQAQLSRLDEYINALRGIECRDAILANAYEAKARNIELGMHVANRGRDLRDDAPANLPTASARSFVEDALKQWELCQEVHLRCCGGGHPDSQAATAEVMRLKILKIQLAA